MGYFDNFPIIPYNITYGSDITEYQAVTNIFFRMKFRELVKNNAMNYYLYTVRDVDTPEGIANKYYGDPQAHWIILYANDIIDPFYDWPLSTRNFREFIIEKYGSVATAKSQVHHYNKIIETTDSLSGDVTSKTLRIDLADARSSIGTVIPYDDYTNLAETYYPNISGTFKDGSAITMVIKREIVYAYEHENFLNEEKRNIRIIRKDHYDSIENELKNLSTSELNYYREIRNF